MTFYDIGTLLIINLFNWLNIAHILFNLTLKIKKSQINIHKANETKII